MALGKGAYAIHHNGREYLDGTIDRMLMERHMARELRRTKGRIKGNMKKRSKAEDVTFRGSLYQLCNKAKENKAK